MDSFLVDSVSNFSRYRQSVRLHSLLLLLNDSFVPVL
jgi:hypothetical protein